jgi:hypothetical protein
MPKQSGTAGQLIINEILPQDLRKPGLILDKKGVAKLLEAVAKNHPDKYRDISFKLGKIGRDTKGNDAIIIILKMYYEKIFNVCGSSDTDSYRDQYICEF